MTVFVRLVHLYFVFLLIITHLARDNTRTIIMPRCSVTEVKSTAQLLVKDRLTLIIGYEYFSLLKTLLWLWNVE